ncbi:plancitoxin-1 [Musca vetustissima]|uniref:plancitoxin-1 n=1 Tax=Musca vetustissima TaxID=27455 RepID=UPI002AB77987|nr:plancitoxin-1 [Musca vetustissima]
MDMLIKLIFLLLLIKNLPGGETKVSCKDEQGKDVDWFYLYKLPMHYAAKNSTRAQDNSGLHYLYLTSKSYDKWTLSEKEINESTSITGLTLEPLFNNKSLLLLAYNDEYPNGTVIFAGGHAKGVVATDGVTGLWLIHSVPKFPNTTHYEYPSTGSHYGQSFLCITLAATEMEKVAEQLLFNEPNIYDHNIPNELHEKFPTFEKVLKKDWIKTAPFNNVLNLISLEGSTFKSFAKSSKFNQELYADFVAPTLDTNLLVETWRNGAGNLDSNCSRNDKVYNIKRIEEEAFGLDFKTTQDHSKWAVSQSVGLKFWRWRLGSSSRNWICVGDINRQQHQLVRGGGVLCQQNSKISKLYRKFVKEYESCSKKCK